MQKFVELARVLSDGVGYTLGLFFATLVMSIPIGFLLMFTRVSRNRVVRGVTGVYVWIMRGTPLLLQLYFFYYGLAFIPGLKNFLVMDRMTAAIVAFTLNYAAYFCEIFRGGMLTIEQGQYEAAKVLGFSKSQTFFRIVLPQLIRVTLPSVSNEVITLVKDTSLARVILVYEIIWEGQSFIRSDGLIWPLFCTGLFYLAFTGLLTLFFGYLERKLDYFRV